MFAVWAAPASACFPIGLFRWINAVEVPLQGVYVRCPKPAELLQPGIHLLKPFWLEPVETPLCVHRGLDEAGIPQHSQVLRDGRLRHAKLTLDLSHGLLGRDQQAQYRSAVRLCNDFEGRFHAPLILHGAYTCQGIFKEGAPGRRLPLVGKMLGNWLS